MGKLRQLLGRNLRRVRQARGMTQAALATAIGRSTDLISRLERGDSAPSFETLETLCEVLSISAGELFGGEPPTGSRSAELDELISGMSDAERAWAAELLRQARGRPREPR